VLLSVAGVMSEPGRDGVSTGSDSGDESPAQEDQRSSGTCSRLSSSSTTHVGRHDLKRSKLSASATLGEYFDSSISHAL